mgnify:CR=1 FL=1
MVRRGEIKKLSWVSIALGVIIFALLAGGCQPAAAPAPKAGPIKMGADIPRTGPAGAVLGGDFYKANMLAVKLTNAAGGINGRPLELVLYDDETNIDLMMSNIKKLIEQDKVVGVVGPALTEFVAAAADTFTSAKVPQIAASGGYRPRPQDRYMFITLPTGDSAVEAAVAYHASKGRKRIATLNPNSALGDEADRSFGLLKDKYGITLTGVERYELTDVDMTAPLSKLWANKPDLIINWSSGKDGAIVFKNMRQLGIGVPYQTSHGNNTNDFIKLLGESPREVYSVATKVVDPQALLDTDPDKARILKFYESWRTEYGADPSPTAAQLYDMATVMIDGIKRAGTDPTPEKVRDALEKTQKFPGAFTTVSFDAARHQNYESGYIPVVVQGARWTIAK